MKKNQRKHKKFCGACKQLPAFGNLNSSVSKLVVKGETLISGGKRLGKEKTSLGADS